jgi:7-carboxy-7-deazaguanine synthase
VKKSYTPILVNTELNIPVMEQFYTIQGEGKNTGRAAYFIRVAGCDVGCTWCDVKESWPVDEKQNQTIDSIVKNALANQSRFVVITGGEPTLYDLSSLTKKLKDQTFEIALETSGTNKILGHFDWICLSPKKFKPVLEENFALAHELKIIVFNNHDLVWANELSKKVKTNCQLYLQAEWEKTEEMYPLIIDFIKENPQWTLSLQTHKYLNIP